MARYRIDCAYHGAKFHGWQRQADQRTVQGELEMWLARLLGVEDPVALTGAGRTDAGVHAAGMVAHFDLSAPCDPATLCRQLAAALPADVVVSALTPVEDDFHARYSATGRTYVYRINTEPTPFGRDRCWRIMGALDLEKLRAAAADVCGEHDFGGFCRAESRKQDNRCRVAISRWDEEETLLLYRVTADRFLHQMVRFLVGTFVEVAQGRSSPERVVEILRSGDVRLCGRAAPPHGLTLERVSYNRDDADRSDLG